MAIGRMPGERQEELFIAASAVGALDNPFYAALDKLLRKWGGPTSLDSPRAELRWIPTGFESPREPSLCVT